MSERPFDPRDPLIAATLLTRLPVPVDHALAERRMAAAGWAYPLAGAAVGALSAAALAAGAALGLAPGLTAALAVAVALAATGALHEDGLADCADGFWGGVTRERRLEIMKDSRIGGFGAAALMLALLTKWEAVRGLPPGEAGAALVAAAALARGWLAAAMRWAPNARPGGLSAMVGRPPVVAAVGGCGAAAALALALLGPVAGLRAACAAAGLALATLWVARAKIGGQTGDVLGAGAALAEIGALASLGDG